MLRLAEPTDPAWTGLALQDFDEVLLDHAHCEKKAAGMAVQLLFRFPEQRFLLQPLSELAREELAHFEAVLARLDLRNVAFRRQRPSPYAGRLHAAIRRNGRAELLDLLLCCALIESRSCERFRLLAEALPDPGLADFYRSLLAAEARHHGLYLELARQLEAPAMVEARLDELARLEADILRGPAGPPRVHSAAGPGAGPIPNRDDETRRAGECRCETRRS